MKEGDGDRARAMDCYRLAADMFAADNSTPMADKCLVKLGMLAAEEASYDVALLAFETVAAHCLDSISKFNAKNHYLNARTSGGVSLRRGW